MAARAASVGPARAAAFRVLLRVFEDDAYADHALRSASKGLDEFNGRAVDVAVTMGCGDECPLVRAGRRVDWKIPDPRDMTPEEFRGVRDLIGQKVRDLIAGLDTAP